MGTPMVPTAGQPRRYCLLILHDPAGSICCRGSALRSDYLPGAARMCAVALGKRTVRSQSVRAYLLVGYAGRRWHEARRRPTGAARHHYLILLTSLAYFISVSTLAVRRDAKGCEGLEVAASYRRSSLNALATRTLSKGLHGHSVSHVPGARRLISASASASAVARSRRGGQWRGSATAHRCRKHNGHARC
jgi:hypothetical protein